MEVTPDVISQIKSLPVEPSESPGAIHLVYCLEDPCDDGVSLTCMVHQILKEHGWVRDVQKWHIRVDSSLCIHVDMHHRPFCSSNGLILPYSDGFGISLAMSGVLSPWVHFCPHMNMPNNESDLNIDYSAEIPFPWLPVIIYYLEQ